MWQAVVQVTIPKFSGNTTEYINRPVVVTYPGGRIPNRGTISNDAMTEANRQMGMIQDTMPNRPYDYGVATGATIVAITWVPR